MLPFPVCYHTPCSAHAELERSMGEELAAFAGSSAKWGQKLSLCELRSMAWLFP